MSQTKIARYGNSLTVRLPAALVRELDLREGDPVNIRRQFSALIVERAAPSRLEARLATVKEQETEVRTGHARGAEVVE